MTYKAARESLVAAAAYRHVEYVTSSSSRRPVGARR